MQLRQLGQMVIFVRMSFLSETKMHIAFITKWWLHLFCRTFQWPCLSHFTGLCATWSVWTSSGTPTRTLLGGGGGGVAVSDGQLLCACQRMKLVATFAWMLLYFNVFGKPSSLQSWRWSNHALTRPYMTVYTNR